MMSLDVSDDNDDHDEGEDEYYVCNDNDNDYDDDEYDDDGNNHACVDVTTGTTIQIINRNTLTFLPLYLK
jgi:hypothetical protein